MGNITKKNLRTIFYAINVIAYPFLIYIIAPFLAGFINLLDRGSGSGDAMGSAMAAGFLALFCAIFLVIVAFFASIIAAKTYLHSFIPAIISLAMGLALSFLLFLTILEEKMEYTLVVLVLVLILLTFMVYNSIKKSRASEQYKSEGFGQIETLDFKKSIKEQTDIPLYNDDWFICKQEIRSLHIYAPASDFYVIRKEYYLNGMIKNRGKYMCNLKFGKWEYFDKEGAIIKVIDEDEKFKEAEVAREDVLKILEKEGWFNRENGEQKILINEENLGTDGLFYKKLNRNMNIWFDAAVVKKGKEITPPLWGVYISTGNGIRENYAYNINGHTGEFTVRHTSSLAVT